MPKAMTLPGFVVDGPTTATYWNESGDLVRTDGKPLTSVDRKAEKRARELTEIMHRGGRPYIEGCYIAGFELRTELDRPRVRESGNFRYVATHSVYRVPFDYRTGSTVAYEEKPAAPTSWAVEERYGEYIVTRVAERGFVEVNWRRDPFKTEAGAQRHADKLNQENAA